MRETLFLSEIALTSSCLLLLSLISIMSDCSEIKFILLCFLSTALSFLLLFCLGIVVSNLICIFSVEGDCCCYDTLNRCMSDSVPIVVLLRLLAPELKSSVPFVRCSGLLIFFNFIWDANYWVSRIFCCSIIFLLLWYSSISLITLSISLNIWILSLTPFPCFVEKIWSR